MLGSQDVDILILPAKIFARAKTIALGTFDDGADIRGQR